MRFTHTPLHPELATRPPARIRRPRKQCVLTKRRYQALSEKFARREDIIVELRARMADYESGVHGLREEVQEKERFKALHEERSNEVQRMVSDRNTREGQLRELAEEITWLRERCEIKPGDTQYMDLGQLRLKGQVEVEQLRAQACRAIHCPAMKPARMCIVRAHCRYWSMRTRSATLRQSAPNC